MDLWRFYVSFMVFSYQLPSYIRYIMDLYHFYYIFFQEKK